MAKQKPVTILNDADETPELLSSAIKDVSEAAKRLLNSPLSMRALCILIKDSADDRVRLEDIEMVLRTASRLKDYALKAKEQKP